MDGTYAWQGDVILRRANTRRGAAQRYPSARATLYIIQVRLNKTSPSRNWR